ncbi:killer toxin alpha/beta [Penicillium cosmopolitanum]|uniref:Killer toxin alpha/beta n=1 Tax=Penicillium cosmopolitanum TaxID=1131564 RepID=A0A9W9SDQ9_9EURO|nr:killer toxin alpha/beta [Penicillium cosmopolitanum]KAJ5376490.1 killer toxin alpha/beta [Penicillium cosmopolitanum]
MFVFNALVLGAGILTALPAAAATGQAQNGSSIYQARFALHNHSTPLFQNVTGVSANPMVRALQSHNSSENIRYWCFGSRYIIFLESNSSIYRPVFVAILQMNVGPIPVYQTATLRLNVESIQRADLSLAP